MEEKVETTETDDSETKRGTKRKISVSAGKSLLIYFK
jgi:hypothetical protein